MKKPTRRDLLRGAAAGASLAGAGGQAEAFRLVASGSGGSGLGGQSFVTNVALGTSRNNYGLGATYSLGMMVTVGSQPITLSAVARMVAPGNSQSHLIRILRISDQLIIPGGAATVNTLGTPAGQFAFVALQGPVVLDAGASYFFLAGEVEGGDNFYDVNSLLTTTTDASVVAACYQLSTGYLATFSGPNNVFPLNFRYTVGVPAGMPALLLGGMRDQDGFSSQAIYTPNAGSSLSTLTGTVSLQVTWVVAPSTSTVFSYVWTMDGNPISPTQTADTSAAPAYTLAYSFDTTTVSDGVHYFYPMFLECNLYPVQSLQPLYYGHATVANHGSPNANPGQAVAISYNKTHTPRSVRPDFITYDGVPNPTHATYPVPYNFIPSGAGDASLRDEAKWYGEVQPGPRTTEYQGAAQWAVDTTGQVYITYLDPLSYSNTPGAYDAVVAQNAMIGTRLNSYISPYTTFVEDPTTSAQWYGVAINGLLFKIDRHGNTTPIVGWIRDTTKLTIDPYSNPSEETIDLYRTLLGNFPPEIGDIGGANDLCFDPRDSNIVYVVSQVDHFICKINLTTKNVTLYAGQPGDTGDYVDGPAASSAFNQPTSIVMASDGTMYVSDQLNAAIRKITPDGSTVSTLCGGRVGPTVPSASTIDSVRGVYSVTSITWTTGTNSGAVVMATPIPDFEVGWAVHLSGAVNSAGQNPNFTYIVSAKTDGSHFTIKPEATAMVPNIGTLSGSMSFTVWNMDYYSRPGSVSFTGGAGWVCYPNTVRFTSTGTLLFVEAATYAVREINLSAQTIRRVGCPDDHIQAAALGWIWIEVDTAGTCGPVDDVFVKPFETEFNAAHSDWRMSLAPGVVTGQPAYSAIFMRDGPSPQLPTYGSVESITAGPGHYPWAIGISRVEGRMITTGMANWQPNMIRIKQASDPVVSPGTHENFDTPTYYRGWAIMKWGTANGFPMESRPALLAIWDESGCPMIGNRSNGINTFEDMQALLTSDASLGAFIQAGMGGAVPRPELTGNDLRDLIYFIRRGTLAGSLGSLPVQPGPTDPDLAPPIVLAVSATRLSATSIRVDWTTNKPTIGLAGLASPTQYAINSGTYCLFSAIESGYGTTHSVTVTVVSGVTPYHYTAIAKDMAGNMVHTADLQVI